ncbi:hypothetical protein V7103_24875 [Neobacillus drentensis]|uniref:hypothetical protein n=1 Tax=Neobacillus drentensis TaxID=220684 RepID=UPI002FFDB690
MDLTKIRKSLEAIYLDYYDNLYTEYQLKFMLLQLFKQYDLTDSQWSELILEAQWKHATEEDYENKRRQLVEENKEDDE